MVTLKGMPTSHESTCTIERDRDKEIWSNHCSRTRGFGHKFRRQHRFFILSSSVFTTSSPSLASQASTTIFIWRIPDWATLLTTPSAERCKHDVQRNYLFCTCCSESHAYLDFNPFIVSSLPIVLLNSADSEGYIISRSDLHDLLLHQIPKERIYMGKKVISLLQNENGVMIRCSDNSTHHGDILVGAGGAYSAVRQNLHAHIKDKGKFLKSDDVVLVYSRVLPRGPDWCPGCRRVPAYKQEFTLFMNLTYYKFKSNIL